MSWKDEAPRRVLFVCTGNTCRSPIAHALYQRVFGPDSAASAGTDAWRGEPATGVRLRTLRPGELDDHASEHVDNVDLTRFDALFLLEEKHRERLPPLPDAIRVEVLAIRDPAKTAEVFDRVRGEIAQRIDDVLGADGEFVAAVVD